MIQEGLTKPDKIQLLNVFTTEKIFNEHLRNYRDTLNFVLGTSLNEKSDYGYMLYFYCKNYFGFDKNVEINIDVLLYKLNI